MDLYFEMCPHCGRYQNHNDFPGRLLNLCWNCGRVLNAENKKFSLQWFWDRVKEAIKWISQ